MYSDSVGYETRESTKGVFFLGILFILFPAASSQRIQNNKMIISYEMHYWKKLE